MRVTVFVFLAVAAINSSASAQSVAESFSPLVGTWETEDTYHPVDGPPQVETGVRTCRLVLRDQYLQCDTEAVNAEGTERSYRWMINYNRVLDRFEMVVETRSHIVWTGRRITEGQSIEDAPISFVETRVRR